MCTCCDVGAGGREQQQAATHDDIVDEDMCSGRSCIREVVQPPVLDATDGLLPICHSQLEHSIRVHGSLIGRCASLLIGQSHVPHALKRK